MNQRIIDPVDLSAIEAELTPERFLRTTNKGSNEIYVVTAHNSPNTMREIGRLREIAFRTAGGGTGKECDIDEFDTMEEPCRQLIVWDPESKLILGGYRYICGKDIRFDAEGRPRIATSHMFRFSPVFIEHCLPYTLELGRSFVRPEYQSSRAGAKAIYVLDNLWDGLGSLTVVHPELKYLFGKVTMYPGYTAECRDMILFFLHKYFPDPDELVRPIKALNTGADREALERTLRRRRLQGRPQDSQQSRPCPRRHHPPAGARLHEPVAQDAHVRHCRQRRVRRRGGKRHLLRHRRHT